MIRVPPFPEEAVLREGRDELATRIYLQLIGNRYLKQQWHAPFANKAVKMADALIAELTK